MTSAARPRDMTVLLRGYLELLRPANVVTAAADVLAGYGVAGLGNPQALPWLLVATSCLYGGGVVLNDYFDRAIDQVERPERPIPSGRVAAAGAAWLGGVLLVAGVIAASQATRAAGVIAGATAGCVLLYDAWGKQRRLFAPVNMGLCRALNLLLGIAAVPVVLAEAWPLALVPLVYIGAVTALSRGEVHGGQRGVAVSALISLMIVLIALITMTVSPGNRSVSGLVLVLFLAWRVLPPFWRACRMSGPGPIRQAVKAGVLSLVLVDASIGATYAGPVYGLVILATAPVASGLARLFPVT
ncbi:MAG: UbiA-like protein EboC [Luteitalea sp.]|nr:UbiA-like protein EboC [Luteitalea sp.]